MKTIQILLFLFAFTSTAIAQNTDPISYHSSHQLSDTSYSLKKANGDSTIFLFEGSASDSAYTKISVNADSTQVIFDGNNHPSDTLEVWGMGNNANSGYTDIVQLDDSTLIFQRTNGESDTVSFFGISSESTGIQPDWNEVDSQQADFIKNKPAIPGIVLTTTGESGNATLTGDTLNIPNYSGNGTGWNLTGNAGTTSSDFIGTTDDVPLFFKVNNTNAGFMSSHHNTAFGYNSLPVNQAGTYNLALGDGSLSSNTSGSKNVAVGVGGVLSSNKTGIYNTGVGYYALYKNVGGHENTAIGSLAMCYDTAGTGNVAIGTGAMNARSGQSGRHAGDFNVAVGWDALQSDHGPTYYDIALGYFAGLQTSISNTLIISDSTYHMKYKLDSAAGIAPSIIGKDANGYWHVYQNPSAGSGSNIILTTSGTGGAATLSGNTLNIPTYTPAHASTTSTGVISVGSGLAIDSAGKLSTSIGLLKPGSVPYAGPGGILSQDTTGLVYDGNNLQVGHSGFYNTTGLSLNGARGYLGASGFGLTIKTNGGSPMDASKSISFYNSSSRYGVMSMRSTSDSTLRFLTDMEIVPSSTNKYNLGSSTNQWNNVYTKQLYLNGILFTGDSQSPKSGTATLESGTVTVSTAEVKAGAKIFVSVNTPSGTQGFLSAPTASIIDNTSFVINSTSATDNSTVNWQIINP